MPLLIRDIAEARLSLELRCRQCTKSTLYAPELLVRTFPPDARFAEIVARLRCSKDGMIPDVCLLLDSAEVEREAARRRLRPHRPLSE